MPVPRPLRRVGAAQDKCSARVKSVYDKRIVLSSAGGFVFSNNAGSGYARFYRIYDSAPASPIASDWLLGYAKSAYGATNEGVYSADSDTGAISIVLSIERLVEAGATSGDTSTYLTAVNTIFAATPLTVYYQSTAYDGTNGLDVCMTEYQTGLVELDGTETNLQYFDEYGTLTIAGILTAGSTTETNVYGVCLSSHFAMVEPGTVSTGDNIIFSQPRLSQLVKTFGKAIIEKQWKTAATQAGAVALGVLLCFGVGADFYAALGVNFNVAWIGIALTGIFASRGANYVSDLVKKLQALGAEKVNNM